MKSNVATIASLSSFVVAIVLLAFVVVKPALAQVDATSSESVIEPIALVEATDAPTTSASDVNDAVAESSEPAQESAPALEEAAPEASNEAPPEGLTEVHVIGTKYIDYFTDGTNTYTFPGDPEVHAHIAERDAAIPTHEGLTWVHSVGRPLYDTPSGDLEVGQYVIQTDGSIIAKYPPFQSSTSTPAAVTAPTAESSSTPENTDASNTAQETSTASPQPTE